MVRRFNERRPWLVLCTALAALAIALPAAAQSTGIVKGVVRDDKGQPVEGAKISIDMTEGVSRHFETKTNRKGEFIQIGLMPGPYKITAEKDKLGSQSFDVRVRISQSSDVNFVLAPGMGTGATKEAAAKTAELRQVFQEGVDASRAGNNDEAIAKFTRAIELKPDCFDCYYNMAYSYTLKKEYDKAEESYKKAIELKADYPDAYNGLANIYNAQRKFDQAAAASTKASELMSAGGAGGGSVEALYNQGVILWNAGKVAEAKKQFEAAIQVNANHAESHYQLGMALVNEGNLAGAANEFETYLKLAPTGPNAAQAKALVAQLKK